ncbi:MAG: hypothetical protein R3305_10385, partial [Gammaproteobacteria bacterium]|nr:hypothetical protein [Gammaproteobacteria bacterium]
MKRTLIVIVLAVAALALLVGAALKSRSVPLEVHVAQFTLSDEIERLNEDFTTLMATLESAWQTSQDPGEAAIALRQRILNRPETIGAAIEQIPGSDLQLERIDNNFERLNDAMRTVEDLTGTLLAQQSSYAANLTLLRDTGPEIVRQLRDASLPRVAQNLFQLLAQTIEYASHNGGADEYEMRRLLAMLDRDQRIDAAVPDEFADLLAAVEQILETKDDTRSRLTQLSGTPLLTHADALNLAVGAAYQSAVSSTEGARTMLSIYAVVMLLSVGLVGFRLRGSYQELNEANAELAVLNESLEQRVQERT